ncbi:hypothetical protein FN846DRAFT_939067 [Sphaerosporella brunnea]|uniref:Pentacotripeptide-repeat region of PRORP domain-containing protein n=1 Tax=Sphaerosporella brunnea TaxID=1250544 RepID=A0A5J5F3D6_9PEZI|nr:hypothetical protein FN846DRAFT_939067 [Sphaerosporella brunnea]
MLERVAVHRLESGGLRFFRGGRSQRRMLHSAFWVHGAAELDLAAAAASLFGGGCGGAGEDRLPPEISTAPQPHARTSWRRAAFAQLDFLYPPGALSFLRHLGSAIPRRKNGGLFPFIAGKREYSSTTQTPPTEYEEIEEITELPELACPDDIDIRRPDGDDYHKFQDFTMRAPPGQYESAWYHYCQKWRATMMDTPSAPTKSSEKKLHDEQMTRRIVAKYMLKSVHRLEWNRVVSMILSVHPLKWAEWDYENLVICFLRLGHPAEALYVLKKNVTLHPTSRDAGFEVFIKHYVMAGRWDLVKRAYQLLRGTDIGRTADRRRHLNSTILPSIGDKGTIFAFIGKVMGWASTVPDRDAAGFNRLDDHLAEDLVKACLSYITRPHAPWYGGLWEEVFQFIENRPRWLNTRNAWERSLKYLAASRQDALATYRYSQYRLRYLQHMDLDIMNRIVRCYARLQDFKGMQMIFDDIICFSDQLKPNRESYSILMAAAARRGDSKAVREILLKSLEEFPPRHPQELNHIMQAHVERGELSEVIIWFNRISEEYKLKPDVISYNTLINGHAKVGDLDGAARRVQEMLDVGLKPDLTTYNIILKMFASRGDVAGAENIFDSIVQSGFELDTYSYQALAAAYVEAKDLLKADTLLAHIADHSFDKSPTPIWNTVISAHAARGEEHKVTELLKVMAEKGVPFDYYTYGIVLHSLCTAGKMEAAESTLEYIKDSGFHLSSDKYAILMVGYTRLGDFRKVWETFQKMLQSGLEADFNTLAVLLKSYAHSEAEDFLEVEGNMVHLVSTEKMLDQIITEERELDLNSFDAVKTATPPWLFTPLINVYWKKSAWDRAIAIFNKFLRTSEAETFGASPNLQMFKTMMQVYRGGGDVDGVRSMWQGLRNTALYLHRSVANKGTMPQRVLETYHGDICGALSIFIRAMAEIQDIEAIDAEIESVQTAGYQLDNVNWNDYVQALVLAGKLTQAAQICERQLMKQWNELRLYFFYSDPSVRGEEGKVLPEIRPFIRTIEAIGTELKRLDELRKRGDVGAKAALVEIFREAPATWEACDGLESMESRASKEMMFRLQKTRQREQPIKYY